MRCKEAALNHRFVISALIVIAVLCSTKALAEKLTTVFQQTGKMVQIGKCYLLSISVVALFEYVKAHYLRTSVSPGSQSRVIAFEHRIKKYEVYVDVLADTQFDNKNYIYFRSPNKP